MYPSNKIYGTRVVFLLLIINLVNTKPENEGGYTSHPRAGTNNHYYPRAGNNNHYDPDGTRNILYFASPDGQEEADVTPSPTDGVEPTAPTPHTLGTTENECPACYLLREDARLLRIEYVKRTILEQLQMTSPPNNSRIVLPKNPAIRNFVEQYSSDPRGSTMQNDQPQSHLLLPPSNIDKMILFPKAAPLEWNINENTSYAFKLSERLFNYDVNEASLHVHIRSHHSTDEESLYYLVLRRVHEPPFGKNSPKIISVTRKKIVLQHARGEWVAINMSIVAQEWLDRPEEHNVIQISLIDLFGNSHDHLLDTNIDSEYRKRSFLVINIQEKRHHRFRRAVAETMTCASDSQMTSCCKYEMLIDFKELAWNWIVYPRTYFANFCHGQCPRMYMLQYARDHIVESMIAAPPGRTGPCCSPLQMSDLPIIYEDTEGNLRFSKLATMTVESCHCA